ncbi:MAG: RNase adapter RapZ [Halanaerobiales bacterium]
MDFIIITGLSGAGKSTALNFFEDEGYFCVDNLPPALLTKFAELCKFSDMDRIAIVIDIRGKKFFDAFFEQISYLKDNQFNYDIIFLEASNKTLISRYKETRRRHPLAREGRVLDAIRKERSLLEEIKGKAGRIIDTSEMNIKEFQEDLKEISDFRNKNKQRLAIDITSFGFKYGIPLDADMVFDVRFLPNPYYVDVLKEKTGQEKEVEEYIMKWPVTRDFYNKFFSFIEFLLPEYNQEGKSHLGIAIGCTGGHHRSVLTAEKLKEHLYARDYPARVEHRDIEK